MESTTSLPVLFISSYDSTTGLFTAPPGGDGVYYFSTYVFVQDDEFGVFSMRLNYGVICSSRPDRGNNGDNNYSTGSCSAVVNVVAGKLTALSVADPGFPRGGGANSPGGGANIRFCQIFPKSA